MYGAVVVFYETVEEHKCGKEMRQHLNIPEEVCFLSSLHSLCESCFSFRNPCTWISASACSLTGLSSLPSKLSSLLSTASLYPETAPYRWKGKLPPFLPLPLPLHPLITLLVGCRFVGNLMLEVPFPTLVRPRIQMHIGSESIVFSLPVQTPLPLR